MKGKVRVFCRIRPMLPSELNRGCQPIITPIDDFNISLETRNGPKTFSYDSCFGPNTTQEQVFEDTKRLIQSAVDGYNVCIFAYGQTGSGKTYTMHGTPENPGITPRAADELFNLLSNMQNFCDINVSLHMVELYLDTLIDLLPQKGLKKPLHLEIKEDIKGMVYIQNVCVINVLFFVKSLESSCS
jgi:Kinesin-like protein